MIIRAEQVAALLAAQERYLVRRIGAHLVKNYPEYVIGVSDAELHRRVLMCVNRARGYGVTWESCLASFTVMAFVYGPNFYDQPAIQKALNDESLDPNIRVKLLPSRTRRRDWSEAAAQTRVWP